MHLSNTGSRISNGTPPVSHSTEERAPALQGESDAGPLLRPPKKEVDSLTVDVVLQRTDALLVQTHHGREEGGLGARVHLHFLVKPLPSEDARLLRGVAGIRLFGNFGTKMSSNQRIRFKILVI